MGWKPEYAQNRRRKYQSDSEERARRLSQSRTGEANREYMRDYYAANPEKFRRTPEQRAEYNRRRRERYANDSEFRDRIRQQARITPEQRHARKCREYGITVADYERLLTEQGGGCAICDIAIDNERRLAIDHDHITGEVRGLLCRACNQGLGQFGDDPERLERAGMYLRTHRRTSAPDK